MKIKLKTVGMLILLLAALSFAPIGRKVQIYRAVLSPAELKVGEHVVTRDADDSVTSADFLVQDGRLYLKFQSVRSSLLMVTYVENEAWSKDRVSGIRSKHPELDALWGKSNGGVYWLDN